MQQEAFTPLNDFTLPTRTGNSNKVDTNPDLTWYKDPDEPHWENTGESLENILKAHTKHIGTTKEYSAVDTHLVSLWTRLHNLLHKWKRQKNNINLHQSIQVLKYEITSYAQHIATNQRLSHCERLSQQLHNRRIWSIFRSLLGNTFKRNHLIKLKMKNNYTKDQLTKALRDTYFPEHNQQPLPLKPEAPETHGGIQSEFTLRELKATL
ncbi:hypothetical protein HPB47_003794 [Ixodes persulcatus]|uniref:Uncharacterized protein n=1 Tax=Ixodes persulcatus TaxID=34615 RepID=A0AC60PIH5_IXOPE|nr:hypothetical protein HPB47_003794 [Ixodes persulcatus]